LLRWVQTGCPRFSAAHVGRACADSYQSIWKRNTIRRPTSRQDGPRSKARATSNTCFRQVMEKVSMGFGRRYRLKIVGDGRPFLKAVLGPSALFLFLLPTLWCCSASQNSFHSKPLLLWRCSPSPGILVILCMGEIVVIGWVVDFLSGNRCAENPNKAAPSRVRRSWRDNRHQAA